MKQLLSIEYAKLKKLTSIKVIFLVYVAIVPLWMLFMGFFFRSSPSPELFPNEETMYSFPGVWRFITYSASWFNVLMGITVVIITCNEIQFRTMRQNVIDGLTKKQFILGKFLVILCIAAIVSLYTAIVGFLIGGFYSGFGGFYENIHYVPTYFLQTLAYFSFAFFFAVLVRKPALSIIFFVVSFIVELIIGVIISNSVSQIPYQFFPLNVFSKLTPNPFFEKILLAERAKQNLWEMPVWGNYLLVAFYLSLFFFIAYRVLKKRDV